VNLKTKQVLAVGFSVVGAIGTVGTAILARKAAMKESIVRKKIHNFESLPLKEKIMALYKIYIPTGIAGIATISSIVGSTIMSNKAQASIMSMAVIADQGWKKYKHQVKSVLGVDAHNDILKSLSQKEQKAVKQHITRDEGDRRELYYDELIGYFQALPEDVMYAYATINEMMNGTLNGYPTDEVFEGVTLLQFVELAKANIIDTSITKEYLSSWGWTMDYLSETKDIIWIHMQLVDEITIDDVEPQIPYKVISWLEDPIMLGVEDYEERLDLDFDPFLDNPNHEYATFEMFGYTKGPDGKLIKIKNDNDGEVNEDEE